MKVWCKISQYCCFSTINVSINILAYPEPWQVHQHWYFELFFSLKLHCLMKTTKYEGTRSRTQGKENHKRKKNGNQNNQKRRTKALRWIKLCKTLQSRNSSYRGSFPCIHKMVHPPAWLLKACLGPSCINSLVVVPCQGMPLIHFLPFFGYIFVLEIYDCILILYNCIGFMLDALLDYWNVDLHFAWTRIYNIFSDIRCSISVCMSRFTISYKK